MSYGDDIITSEGFEPDEDDEFDSAEYNAQFSPDDEDWDEDELADR